MSADESPDDDHDFSSRYASVRLLNISRERGLGVLITPAQEHTELTGHWREKVPMTPIRYRKTII